MESGQSTVKRVLEHRGIRQGWLADKLEISDAYLSKLLSGDKPWTVTLKQQVAFWLGVPEDMLFFEAECHQKEHDSSHDETGTVSLDA